MADKIYETAIKRFEINDIKAFALFERASLRGHGLAQFYTAYMLWNGKGVDKNEKKALHRYQLAITKGGEAKQRSLAELYEIGVDVSSVAKTCHEIERSGETQFQLGKHYYELGNYVAALKMFMLASEQNYGDAQNIIGSMYYVGDHFTRNYTEAVKWYLLASQNGSSQAQNTLGAMYTCGEGVEIDNAMAVKWFRMAIQTSDNMHAHQNLGTMYLYGRGVTKDLVAAVHHLTISIASGNLEAIKILNGIRGTPGAIEELAERAVRAERFQDVVARTAIFKDELALTTVVEK